MRPSVVIGGSGQLGRALRRLLEAEGVHAFATYRSQAFPRGFPLDITDRAAVRRFLEEAKPEVVYLAGAYTHVDGCEEHPDEALRVNVDGTRHVLEASRDVGARLVFFSTDYVFDGKDGPYREEDKTAPLNVYGKTKLQAETMILAQAPDALILRTCGVYGFDPEGKNFIMQLLANLKAGRSMTVPRDQYGTPTLAADLAAAAFELVRKGGSGLYNAAGPDYLNRYEFALRAAEGLGLPQSLITPAATSALRQKAKRPMKGGLLNQKILRRLDGEFRGVSEGIAFAKAQAAAAGASAG